MNFQERFGTNKSTNEDSSLRQPQIDIETNEENFQSNTGPNSMMSLFDSHLNIGKFTLDWIKTNSNSYNMSAAMNENESEPNAESWLYQNNEFDEEEEDDYGEEEDDEEDNDDDDDDDDDSDLSDVEKQAAKATQKKRKEDEKKKRKNKKKKSFSIAKIGTTDGNMLGIGERGRINSKSMPRHSLMYEAKCAFSHYWTDFDFDVDGSEKSIAHDLNQFWHLYYPYRICRPLLLLINCRIFYIRFIFLRKIVYFLRRLKVALFPMREFDTGHGFKLFSS
jgi:cobalamin biosynthesis protein CobT